MSTLPARLLTPPYPQKLLADQPKLLSITQAARRLGVNPMTLRRWEKAGLFTTSRTLGGKRRYTEATLVQLTTIHQTPPIPPSPPLVMHHYPDKLSPLHQTALTFTATMLVCTAFILGVSTIQYSLVSLSSSPFTAPSAKNEYTQVLGASTASYREIIAANLTALPKNLSAFYAGFLQELPNPLLLFRLP